MVPYQLTPSDTNVRISILLLAVVIVGEESLDHLTLVKVDVKLPAPVLSNSVKLRPASGFGIVNTQLAVRTHVCIVPLLISIVLADPVFPESTKPSL